MRLSCVVFLTLATASFAQAPATLTPGAIGNEEQRRQEQIEQNRPAPQILPQLPPVIGAQPAPSASASASSARFRLNGVTFDMSAFLGQGELDAAAQAYIGRDVNFADLSALVTAINALYDAKGEVAARAVLIPQQVQNGVVHIALIEGRVGNVEIVGAQNTREDFIRDRIPATKGEVLDVSKLSAAIIYFNRTGDVQLRALMRPGANFGETDLQLAVQEPASDTLDVFADNEGVDSTGQDELGLSYHHNELFHRNDRAYFYGILSEGGITGSASYDLPIDVDNTRLGVTYQHNNIDVVHGPVGGLGITGHGQSAGVNVTRPFEATSRVIYTGILNAAYSTSLTGHSSGVVSDSTSYRVGAGLSLTYIGEDLLAVLTPQIAVARSHDNVLHKDRDLVITSTSASARLNLDSRASLRFLASGQYVNSHLLPGEFLFQIGGPASVRGYASGTFAGDSGFYGNLELHRDSGDFLAGLDFFAFADGGVVYSTSPARRTLSSAGAGFVFSPAPILSWSGSFAAPLEKATSKQDDYRAYLQLMLHFS